MSRTLEQKIADAEARLQRLKAKSRSLDTAQKVVVGAALLAKVRKPEEVQLRAFASRYTGFLRGRFTSDFQASPVRPIYKIQKGTSRKPRHKRNDLTDS